MEVDLPGIKNIPTIVLIALLFNEAFASITPAHSLRSKYRLTQGEKKVSHKLKLFLKHYKKNKMTSSQLNTLSRAIKNKDIYFDIQANINNLINIAKINRSKLLFKKRCLLYKNKESSKIKIYLNGLAKFKCNEYFVNFIIQSPSMIRQKIYLNYFSDNLQNIMNNHHQLLIIFLKKTNKNNQIISNIISHQVSGQSLKINPKILSFIHIDHQLAKFIQKNNLLQNKNRNFFYEEVVSMKKEVYKHLKASNSKVAILKSTQILSFYSENLPYFPHKKTTALLNNMAKKFVYNGDYIYAGKIFRMLLKGAKAEEVESALFHILWPSIVYGDIEHRVNLIRNYELVNNFDAYGSRLQFWTAYSLRKYGEKNAAKKLYKKLINKHPLSFYSIIASRELFQYYQTSYFPFKRLNNQKISINKMSVPKKFHHRIKRILLWINSGIPYLAKLEFQSMIQLTETFASKENLPFKEFKEYIISHVTKTLSANQLYLDSFKFIYLSTNESNLSLDNNFLTTLFPTHYYKMIKKQNKSINPTLVLSLIRQESAFNPYARSRVGARGLMQLMPSTAKMYKRRLKSRQLDNPKLNISLGTKYLKKLLNEFDNNIIFSLAAYNAGETRVRRWRKNLFINENFLSTIETIPFKETRNYVKLIYRNIFFYNYLNPHLKENPLKYPIKETFITSKI